MSDSIISHCHPFTVKYQNLNKQHNYSIYRIIMSDHQLKLNSHRNPLKNYSM
jgi:hypothetical protein